MTSRGAAPPPALWTQAWPVRKGLHQPDRAATLSDRSYIFLFLEVKVDTAIYKKTKTKHQKTHNNINFYTMKYTLELDAVARTAAYKPLCK